MIGFPAPCSALVTLPVLPDGEGIGRVLALEALVLRNLDGVTETIPAFNRLLISGSPDKWDPALVSHLLNQLIPVSLEAIPAPVSGPTVELPTCYDPDLGEDLLDLAAQTGLTPGAVAKAHAGPEYRVLATGFAPGFAYLGDVDHRIAVARHGTPRPCVEAGSVGIADRRTGVYPSAGPGGWQLIGRVPKGLFADVTARIKRFEPGGTVRFRPIAPRDFVAEGGI
jgi:KipI family sensor histidine kinase inhibitor